MIESAAFCIGGMIILNWVYLGAMLIVTLGLGYFILRVTRKFLRTTKSFIEFIEDASTIVQETYNEAIDEIW